MAKKDFIPFEEAIKQQIVANSVSKDVIEREFGDMKRRLEMQERKLDKQENLSFVATAFQMAIYAASNRK